MVITISGKAIGEGTLANTGQLTRGNPSGAGTTGNLTTSYVCNNGTAGPCSKATFVDDDDNSVPTLYRWIPASASA